MACVSVMLWTEVLPEPSVTVTRYRPGLMPLTVAVVAPVFHL
jgi:hypothetical protein